MSDIIFDTELEDVPVPFKMPAPPSFLINIKTTSSSAPDDHNHVFNVQASPQYTSETNAIPDSPTTEYDLPNTIDSSLYKMAIEERKLAEMSYAEIYSEYLTQLANNEKLFRKLQVHERYKKRVRFLFNLSNKSKQIGDIEIEEADRQICELSQSLRTVMEEKEILNTSIEAHQAAINELTDKLARSQEALNKSERHFNNLATEFDKQSRELSAANTKISALIEDIDSMNNAILDVQERHLKIKQEKTIYQTQVSQLHRREAALINMNEKLTDKMVELKTQKDQEVELLPPLAPIAKTPSTSAPNTDLNSNQIQSFVNRWTKIIDELSSHSSSLSKKPMEDEQLVSEQGDLGPIFKLNKTESSIETAKLDN